MVFFVAKFTLFQTNQIRYFFVGTSATLFNYSIQCWPFIQVANSNRDILSSIHSLIDNFWIHLISVIPLPNAKIATFSHSVVYENQKMLKRKFGNGGTQTQGRDSPTLKLSYLSIWLALFQGKTLLEEKTVKVELG